MTFFLKKILFFLSLFSVSFSISKHEYMPLIEKYIEEINKGRVITLVQPDDSTAGINTKAYIIGIAFIDANPEEILKVLKDVENYHVFMPSIERVSIHRANKDSIEANYYALLPFGIKRQYRLLHTEIRSKNKIIFNWEKVDWPGLSEKKTLQEVEGQWCLIKKNNASGTLVVYSTYLDIGYVPWGTGWIIDSFTRETVKNILQNTRYRCELITKRSP